MTLLSLIADNIGAFLTVVFAVGGLIWHLITQYFAFQTYKKQVDSNTARITETENKNATTNQNVSSIQKAIVETNTALKNEILLSVAENEKLILLRIVDQEKRNGEHQAALTKAFGAIQNQMELMNAHLGNVTSLVKIVSDRTESMEKEKMEELKQQLDSLRKKHND